MFRAYNAIIIALVTVSLAAQADSITVRDGDVLNGELRSIRSGAVFFENPIAGTTLFPIDQILQLKTDGLFKFKLKNGDRLSGYFGHDRDGAFIATSQKGELRITLDDIDTATPMPEFISDHGNSDFEVDTGAFIRSGSRDSAGAYLRLEYEPDPRITSRLRIEHGGEDSFPDGLRAETFLRPTREDAVYPLITANVERDTLEGVDWRAGIYAGIGWEAIKTKHQRVSLSASVGGSYQDIGAPESHGSLSFPDHVWTHFYGLERGEDEWAPEARFGIDYEGRFGKRAKFTDRLYITPRLDDGALRGRYESAFEWGISERFGLRLNLQLDYDSEPVLHFSDQWRTTVGAGVRVRF